MNNIYKDKAAVLSVIREKQPEIAVRFTVRRIGIFGSFARGAAGPESDVDILVELDEPTFDNYMDLKFYLEEILNHPVDLVIHDAIKPRLKPIIEKEVLLPRDFRLYLDDLLEAVTKIRDYTTGMDYDAFIKDPKTQDAVVRNLEIIGEAAGRLPQGIRTAAHDIEWRKIVALRNILAHEYFGVSLPVVWDIVQNKLDPLEISCQILFKKLQSDEK